MDQEVALSQRSLRHCQRRLFGYLTSSVFLMYVYFFISSWGDCMWLFAIGVYMIGLYPSSLELTAIYGFVLSGASLLLGSMIGDWIDSTPRLTAAVASLFLRNLAISGCSSFLVFVFVFWEQVKDSVILEVGKGVVILFAVLVHLGSTTNNITMTKDWAVVICAGDKSALMEMSAFFRRIDLVCKILAPIVVGQIMSFASNSVSAVFICCENIVTLIVMYVLLRIIYRRVPRLAVKEKKQKQRKKRTEEDEDEDEEQEEDRGHKKKQSHFWIQRLCATCISLGKGWSCYIRQPVAAAGVSLAMMYMTVLGFDNITVGYAYSQGLSPSLLSAAMAATAVTGILGTLLFQPMRRRLGLVRSGVAAFVLDLVFLQLCLWSVFAPGTAFLQWPAANATQPVSANVSVLAPLSNTTSASSGHGSSVNVSLLLLLTGIVLSRIGLWLVDLVVTQLILETVSERERGKVNGVQFSLNMFLDLLKFLLVILVPEPAYFGFLVMASFGFIVLGFVIFLGYSCWRRCADPEVEEANAEVEAEAELVEGSGEVKG